MKRAILAVSALSLLMLSACFQKSISPFYSEDKLIFLSEIEGEWTDNNNYKITINKGKDYAYEMTAVDDEGQSIASLSVHFFKIFGTTFMDLYPEDLNPDISNNYYSNNILPMHSVVRVSVKDASIDLEPLSAEWVYNTVISGKYPISHRVLDGNDMVLLTGDTNEQQNFLAYSINYKDAYRESDTITWKRQ